MERLTIDELIAHCDRQLDRLPSGNKMYQEHESTRAYLQMLRHYLALGTVEHLTELVKAESEGWLALLSIPMLPMVKVEGDSDVYCPRCGYDLSGSWNEYHTDQGWTTCMFCGRDLRGESHE